MFSSTRRSWLGSQFALAGTVLAAKPSGRLKLLRSSEIQSSPWGIHWSGYAPSYPEKQLLDRAAELGIKWIRTSGSWSEVEKKEGVYDWAPLDGRFNGAIERGIHPIVQVGGGNELYTPQVSGYPPTSSERAMSAWLRFLAAMVGRYKSRIRHWEIWNEPNHPAFWKPKPNPQDYARLLVEAAKIIRSADPDAVIAGGVMSGTNHEFADQFLSAGAAQSLDKMVFHPYGNVPEETVEGILNLRDVCRKHNPKIELWQNECGFPSTGTSAHGRMRSPWGEAIQAKWLLRRLLTDHLCGCTLSAYFMLCEQRYTAEQVASGRGANLPPRIKWPQEMIDLLGQPPDSKWVGTNTKGLIRYGTWQPKPAFQAMQNLCSLIHGDFRIVPNQAEFKVTSAGCFSGIDEDDRRFPCLPMRVLYRNGKGESIFVYWLPWQPQEIVKPATVNLAGIPVKDPALVDLLDGSVRKLESLSGLPLLDSPLAIANSSALRIS